MASLEIESSDVVRLILQYLREANLMDSYAALQRETGVEMNVVENLDSFLQDVRMGHWDTVLKNLAPLRLPDAVLIDVYEQIVLELAELKEMGAARSLLRQTDPMLLMKEREPERYVRLESVLARANFDMGQVYGESGSKELRREAIAAALAKNVTVAPPSRLLALLQQALKLQHQSGLLPQGEKVDVFRGVSVKEETEHQMLPLRAARTIKFGAKSYSECAAFSPDGHSLVTGSVEGFIEVWNPKTGKLRKDLAYQAEDRIMMMEAGVISLSFSRDSEMLCSGSKAGQIKVCAWVDKSREISCWAQVWHMPTGKCLRKFDTAHSQGVTSVSFSKDNTQVLSSSFDQLVRIHGMRTRNLLKEFRGHTSFVNAACFSSDQTQVLSASSDSTVRVWDVRSGDCLHVFRGLANPTNPAPGAVTDVSITTLLPLPRRPGHYIVGSRCNTIHLINVKGEIVKSFVCPAKQQGDFVTCATSPLGDYVFGVAEDRNLYCFTVATGNMERSLPTSHERDVLGVCHHPRLNILSTWSEDGRLLLWRPE